MAALDTAIDAEFAEVIDTFLSECHDLLEQMENGLLRIDAGSADAETINAIFRAAHTIKGSAGIFACDDIVAFTHVVESVLDRSRAGELAFDSRLTGLLLASRDHIAALVAQVAAPTAPLPAAVAEQGRQLLSQLAGYLGTADLADAAAPRPLPSHSHATTAGEAGERAATGNWHISLRFARDLLQSGMDPLSFLRYLRNIGDIVGIATVHDDLPELAELDAEACYLGFEINFASSAERAAIDETFDFVRSEASIHLLPPHSPLAAYADMIAARPETAADLGAVLLSCGTLNEAELAQVLAMHNGAHTTAPTATAVAAPPAGALVPSPAGETPRQKTVRVDADKLDRLINLVGELVIAGAGTSLVAGELRVARLSEAASTMTRLIEEVRDSTLNLRMVQIGETFNRFQRVVRDVARDLGKEIRLEINGADTELDKTVVEKIGDPLLHLVRNAMDHGIETAASRQASGKPAAGTIRLNAYHDSGSVVIEVADDGAGLDSQRILRKAREKGLVGAQQQLSEADIHKLIFAPGFSTAEQLTNLSGRGVGMDVVKKNIEALRGSIDIVSTPGAGSLMRIRLPLTLAIIDGFLVGVGDSSFVIPLDQVVECIDLSASDRREADRRQYVDLRGQILPYTRLRDAFAMDSNLPPRSESIVVVKYGQQRAGLAVDRLLGEIQTVIKPLARVFSGVAGISGSSILGNGQVALILDIPRLIQHTIASAAETQNGQFQKEISHD